MVNEVANDGLEPEDGLMKLGQWGAIEQGPFPLAPYIVHMSDLLKYNTIQYNTMITTNLRWMKCQCKLTFALDWPGDTQDLLVHGHGASDLIPDSVRRDGALGDDG